MQNDSKILLMGCGILKKEAESLIRSNDWPVDTLWFDSSLHVNFAALEKTLRHALNLHPERRRLVFYGTCHPLMHRLLSPEVPRTPGQNCIEILLGPEAFHRELAAGAFFLLEDWALRWDRVISKTFGHNKEAIRQIFQQSHTYFLCLRTPCSGDFSLQAAELSVEVGLPLRWLDVELTHLESVLANSLKAIEDKNHE